MTYLLIEDDNTFNKFLFTDLEAGKVFWEEYRKLPFFVEKLCTVTEIEYDGEENEFYSVFYGEELPKVFGVDKGRDALNKAVKEFGLLPTMSQMITIRMIIMFGIFLCIVER